MNTFIRFIHILTKFIIAIIPYFFSLYVFVIPKYLSFIIPNSPFVITCILWAFIVLSHLIYIILNIQWIFNLNVKSQTFIKTAKIVFFITIALGIIASYGIGLLFTAPSILLSTHLLFVWHPMRLRVYQQHKIRARTFSGNKNRLLARMRFRYPM